MILICRNGEVKQTTLTTKSIHLWLINNKDENITLHIPFSYVYVLELEDVFTTVGHIDKGEFMEFLNCKKVNLTFI